VVVVAVWIVVSLAFIAGRTLEFDWAPLVAALGVVGLFLALAATITLAMGDRAIYYVTGFKSGRGGEHR